MRELLFAAAIATATLAGCSKSDSGSSETAAKEELPSMTVADVERELAAGTLKAVDCNGDKLRKAKGVLPDAILLSDEETFTASELPADKSTKLLFYCSGPG